MVTYEWINHLLKQIDLHKEAAWNTISELEELVMSPNQQGIEYASEIEFQQEQLATRIRGIDILVSFALEHLCCSLTREKYSDGYEKLLKKIDTIECHPYADYWFSPLLEFQLEYITILKCFSSAETLDTYSNLERVLRGTPKIIYDRRLKPQNEAEVRRCVYDVLVHLFPDTVREIPIAKVSKSYKPDIGVKSLKAAVEYKFADSEEETKKVIGGIYEDVMGYAGSEDWTTYYAVIYMTDAFLTQEQIEAEFKMSSVPNSWKLILVNGKGGRIQKKKHKAFKKAKK